MQSSNFPSATSAIPVLLPYYAKYMVLILFRKKLLQNVLKMFFGIFKKISTNLEGA